jgi:hypothetical protein
MLSPSNLLPLARLSDAAYSVDPETTRQRVEALGLDYIDQVSSDACSVTLARWGGHQVVAVQGTRVEEHTSLDELWCDIDVAPARTALGTAMAGFWDPLAQLWPEVARRLDSNQSLVATGHSLGGVRAQLVPALTRRCGMVVSYGAPQGAEVEFWRRIYGRCGAPLLTRVVYERDFAPGWPWLDGVRIEYDHPPGPFVWLHGGRAEVVPCRPPLNLSVGDHSIDRAYIPALEALA